MFYFWYCFDDWLAGVTATPWVGDVPWWVPLVVSLMLSPFMTWKYNKDE
jgi:hypothetical protein